MEKESINFLHLIAACVWIGGMIFINLIFVPSLNVIAPTERGKLQGIVSVRFSIIAWISALILIITGILKTPSNLYFDTSTLVTTVLMIKHILIAVMIIIGVSLSLILAPRLKKLAPQPGSAPSVEFLATGKKLQILGWFNMILGILVVLAASALW